MTATARQGEITVQDERVRPFYTVASLAALLAISERTVRDMLNRDELPWYRIGPQRRIDPADVDVWLGERRHG
jgi:excisionase family DNA binding protein